MDNSKVTKSDASPVKKLKQDSKSGNGNEGKVPFKPSVNNVASPYVLAKKPQEVIDFAVQVFDATPLRKVEMKGEIGHAEFKIGDSVIMVGSWKEQNPQPVHVHVYVHDVEETYAKALKAGATSVMAPAQVPPEHDKRGGVVDPSGAINWWISTQVELDPEQL